MKKILFLLFCFTYSLTYSQSKYKDYSNILQSKNIYEMNAFLRDTHPDDPKRMVIKPRVMALMEDYIKEADPNDRKVREMQENLARLKRSPSTKITFEEYNDKIKQKMIAKLQADLQNPTKKFIPSDPKNVYVTNKNQPEEVKKEPAKGGLLKNVFSKPSTSTSSNTSYAAKPIANNEAAEFNSLMSSTSTEHKSKTVKILNSLFDNDPNSKECIVMVENKSDCNIIVRIDGVGEAKYRLAVPAHDSNSVVVTKGSYLLSSLVCGAQYSSQKTIQKPLLIGLK